MTIAVIELLGSLVRILSSEPLWQALYRQPSGLELLNRLVKKSLGSTMRRFLDVEQALGRVRADIEAEELSNSLLPSATKTVGRRQVIS